MTNLQAAKNRLNNQLDHLMRQKATISRMQSTARTQDQFKATEFARLMNDDNINCIKAVLKELEEA